MNFLMFLNKLSTIGQWMTSRLLFVSLEVTAFALIVWIVLKVVRFRSARVREALWVIVLFKMVLSLFIGLPISLSFISKQNVTPEHTLEYSAPPVEQNIQQSQNVSPSVVSSTESSKTSQADFVTDKVELWQYLNWQQGIAVLWLLGCGLMLGRTVFGLLTLGKLRKNTHSVPESLQRTLRSCKEQLKIRSTVNLQLTDNIAAPILFGFWRPVIVLPSWFVERFSQSELRLMLTHELAHWKYRDTWMLFAKRLIEAIFFFHPVVWYAGKQVVKEAEVACDELVVNLSQESTSYANCLIQILQRTQEDKRQVLEGLAVGGNATANRIRKILEEGSKVFTTKIKPQTIIALVLVAFLGLPSCLVGKDNSDEDVLKVKVSKPKVSINVPKPESIEISKRNIPEAKLEPPEVIKLSKPENINSIPVSKDVSTEVAVITRPTGSHLGEYEYGAVVWGEGKDIKGEVHIGDILYSDGNFWNGGLPAYLEKWMSARSKVNIDLIVQAGKSVYLSWPPEDWTKERIQGMSEYVDKEGVFKQPILLMSRFHSDVGVDFSQSEVKNLRKYLVEKGGFLFIDDDKGENGAFYQSVRKMLKEALPNYPIEPIPNDHEIYRCYYEIGGPPDGSISWMHRKSKKDYLEGIFIDDRLAVLISDRDYWDALIGRGPYSPGILRFCTNMVIYAVTRGGIADSSQYKP